MDSLMLGPLRMAQMVSLTGIAIGSLGLVWLYVWNRSLPDVVSEIPSTIEAPVNRSNS
jgi:phosphatidylglycerol:prolipoprotein diacylglycerol transferase